MFSERRDATEEEIQTLRHVADELPLEMWIVAVVGGAERFTFYAITAPWQNFMQNRMHSGGVPGVLGLGQSKSTSIYNGFFMFSFLLPMFFAFISDMRLGRYMTFLVSLWIYVLACLVMFITSLPPLLSRGAGLGGLIVSMVLVGIGVGGTKATQPPLLADQYVPRKTQVARTKKGELVVISRDVTLGSVYNIFHLIANAASISALGSTYLASQRGFWAAFLLPLCSSCLAAVLLTLLGSKLVKLPPQKDAFSQPIDWLVFETKKKFKSTDDKESSTITSSPGREESHQAISNDLKQAFKTARIILSFTVFYLCYNQISNNLVSQAGQMKLHGFPNDGLQALNGLASVLVWPFVQLWLYPYLRNRGIQYTAIQRAGTAFVIMGVAMAYSAVVQKLIYSAGPCYDAPRSCTSDHAPNNVSVWIQSPSYAIIALSALFGFVALQELAYQDAPPSMKAVIQSLTQLTQAIGAALGLAISPVAVDPHLVIMYACLAGVSGLSAAVFMIAFRRYQRREE